jgi:hypothetical protein
MIESKPPRQGIAGTDRSAAGPEAVAEDIIGDDVQLFLILSLPHI